MHEVERLVRQQLFETSSEGARLVGEHGVGAASEQAARVVPQQPPRCVFLRDGEGLHGGELAQPGNAGRDVPRGGPIAGAEKAQRSHVERVRQ